jgi:phosphomevalonate kinase
MTLKQVKAIAKEKGIKSLNMKKDDLIRTIQRTEGNFDCFGSAGAGGCDQVDCLWREDCLK